MTRAFTVTNGDWSFVTVIIHKDVHFPTYLCPEMHGKSLWKRGRTLKDGNYGLDGVDLVGTRRVCPCRTHYGIYNGILLEVIKTKVRE